ncbi:MAG: STAS domain-containing protein [Candidatus Xenobia bacterium]
MSGDLFIQLANGGRTCMVVFMGALDRGFVERGGAILISSVESLLDDMQTLVLNLDDVSSVDAAGLRLLVTLYRMVAARGRHCEVLVRRQSVRAELAPSGLNRLVRSVARAC